MPHIYPTVLGTLLTLLSLTTLANHSVTSEENPIIVATDAFGTSVGGESIGLYQAGNVRGFSPIIAGNVRLNGLYFDQQAPFTGRLVQGTSIRVGPTTLGDPFPAPTGIADVRLRRPGTENHFRVAPQINTFGSSQLEIDAQLPLQQEHFRLAGGVGLYQHRYPEGGDASVMSAAFIPWWLPADGVEIMPFWSHTDTRNMDINPVILVNGSQLPPKISRRQYSSQPWATVDRQRSSYGVMGSLPITNWTLRAGLFRSVEKPIRSFSMQFRDTTTEGDAERIAIANPTQRFASTSGELRLSRTMLTESAAHLIHFSARGREQSRRYGGSDRISLGYGRIGERAPVPEPDFSFSAQTYDEVRQWTGSFAYEGRKAHVGELSVGVQKADYRKQVSSPTESLPITTATPWLYNASTAIYLTPRLALYGNYSQGLEESPIAPEVANNRDEAPPAVETKQTDFGLRWRAPGNLQVIAGLFRIDKPYFAIDREQVFRQLGKQQHQGFELSVSGQLSDNLTLVSGVVLMDPTVQIDQIELGISGNRPIGKARQHFTSTLDYRLPSMPELSLDLSLEYTGKQSANLDNTLGVPATTLVDLGARYRFTLGNMNGTLRVRMLNAFDAYAWEIRGNGAFGYNSPRQLTMRVTLDF